MARNGVLHVIDGVIMPPPDRFGAAARAPPRLSADRRRLCRRGADHERPSADHQARPRAVEDSPESSLCASWSCSSFWITRFSGRAP